MSFSRWKDFKLDDVLDKLGDGLHGTPIYDENGDYFFINGNNLNGNIVLDAKTKKVGSEEYNKYKKELTDRTILLSINGTLGNVAEYKGEKVVLGKSACYLNVKNNYDKKYIKYILHTDNFKLYLNTHSTGTTIKNMGLKQLREYKLLIPPLQEQKAIAHVLSTLDDKIEVNNRINKTLEDMAQAIFKWWFVDFEFPNDDGEPYKSSGGEMVESELGMIPMGWSVSNVFDNVIERKVKYKDITDTNIPVLSIVKEGEFLLSEDYFTKQVFSKDLGNYKLIHYNDFGYNPSRANIGSIAVLRNFNKGLLSPIYKVFSLKKPLSPEYMVMYMKQDIFTDLIAKNSSGTTRQNFDYKGFSSFLLALPSHNLQQKFATNYQQIEKLIKNLHDENNLLRTIRDTIIPKLMSGELRVPIEES